MLVGGLNPSEKYEFVNWDDYSQWENKKCSSHHQPDVGYVGSRYGNCSPNVRTVALVRNQLLRWCPGQEMVQPANPPYSTMDSTPLYNPLSQLTYLRAPDCKGKCITSRKIDLNALWCLPCIKTHNATNAFSELRPKRKSSPLQLPQTIIFRDHRRTVPIFRDREAKGTKNHRNVNLKDQCGYLPAIRVKNRSGLFSSRLSKDMFSCGMFWPLTIIHGLKIPATEGYIKYVWLQFCFTSQKKNVNPL